MRATAIALILAASLAGCDGTTDPEPGRLTGRLDGIAWNGSALVGTGPADGAVLMSEMITGNVRRRIWVNLDFGSPGTYEIPEGGAAYESTGLGAGGDPYYVTASGGTIVITRDGDGMLEGRLDITFGSGGEALRFSDGVFSASMELRRYF